MRRALLCVSSEYRDPAFTPLQYPLSDADQIQQLLSDPELCGFDEVEILKNAPMSEAHEAVERLTADSEADDLILFYFSGHGKLARDGSVALVLSDTKEGRLLSTGLLDNQLRILFNASRARQRVIILDCCYSGAVGEEGFKRSSSDAVEALAQQVKGTFVLTASTKFQPAMECEQVKGSAFTSCLIEGVRTGAAADKGTGCVTLAKLGEYLSREVPLRSNQQPKFWDFGGVGGIRFSSVPRRFDAQWTEQTLKRLRHMMAREQIDDHLFVELHQILEGAGSAVDQERLLLIDDLVEKRLKPLPFLRKLVAARDSRRPPTPDNAREPGPQSPGLPLSPSTPAPRASLHLSTGGEAGAESEPLSLPDHGVALPEGTEGEVRTLSEPVQVTSFIPLADPDSKAGDDWTGDNHIPHPNSAHLFVSILALLASPSVLAAKPTHYFDSYGYPIGINIGQNIYFPFGLLFVIVQVSLVICLWRYVRNTGPRIGLITLSLLGLFGFASAIDGRSISQLKASFLLTLGVFGLLLLSLYLRQRGRASRQRMGEEV